MRPPFLASFLCLLLTLGVVACSSEAQEAVVPLNSLVGRWDSQQAWVTYYGADGQPQRRDDLPGGRENYYLFGTNGEVECYSKNTLLYRGRYEYTGGTQVHLVFDHGAFLYDIIAFTATELHLEEDTRQDSWVPEPRRNQVTVNHLRRH